MLHKPESRFYQSSGLRLHYLVWGDEANPPLLLIHGGRDHAHVWDQLALELVSHYCIYVPDLRGHGDSDWATATSMRSPISSRTSRGCSRC